MAALHGKGSGAYADGCFCPRCTAEAGEPAAGEPCDCRFCGGVMDRVQVGAVGLGDRGHVLKVLAGMAPSFSGRIVLVPVCFAAGATARLSADLVAWCAERAKQGHQCGASKLGVA